MANWIIGTSVVQCEANRYPIRSRGGLSPHKIYYGWAPTASYSAVLGNAYKTTTTEYRLQLAKRILMQVKKDKPDIIISTELVEHWIRIGDEIWSNTLEDTDDDPEENLLQAFHAGVIEAGLNLDDGMELVPDDNYDDPAPVREDGDGEIESDGSNNDPPIGEMVDDLDHYEFHPDDTVHDDSDKEEQEYDIIDTDDVLLAKGSTMDDVEVETIKTPEMTVHMGSTMDEGKKK
jgi:hypothetical protein